MKVSELIEILKRCPQDWIVMYDANQECLNESMVLMDSIDMVPNDEYAMSVDDVLVGSGTTEGFCFLSADPIPEDI